MCICVGIYVYNHVHLCVSIDLCHIFILVSYIKMYAVAKTYKNQLSNKKCGGFCLFISPTKHSTFQYKFLVPKGCSHLIPRSMINLQLIICIGTLKHSAFVYDGVSKFD